MKKIFILLFYIISISSFAQKPFWTIDEHRLINYPYSHFFCGYAINIGHNTEDFSKALKASAKSELIENIQVSIQSVKENYKSEVNGVFSESFTAMTSSFSDADIIGLQIEYFYDSKSQTGFAFAYTNKNELHNYYKNKIDFLVRQIENIITIAENLEIEKKKGLAKKKHEETPTLFEELRFNQSLLIAIGKNDDESTQIEKSLALEAKITSALARMQSAISIFIKSYEKNLGQSVRLLEPKLKSVFSQRGCSFTNYSAEADWILSIRASSRSGNEIEGLFFAYLDVTVSLIDQHSEKEIYSNIFTNMKGGGLDYESAGRKAYDSCLQHIANEIMHYLEN